MDTQYTPLHIHLWNRDFWLLACADMLMCMTVTMLIPTLPRWLLDTEGSTAAETGLCMAAFGVGLYLLGGLCSWLVQRYRRNVVCMWAIAGLLADIGVLWYIDSLRCEFAEFWVVLVVRLLMGATFGLSQMVLKSTLIIDTCESAQRTEANYSASWFSRFALSLGPLAGMLFMSRFGFGSMLLSAMCCAVLSLLLIKLVSFPFRAPEDQLHVVSLDRFLLPQGTVLFINLLLIGIVAGLVLSRPLSPLFYTLMMGGFLLALLAQRFVFREAELKSVVMTGLILLVCSLLVLLVRPSSSAAPLLFGLSIGITSSRFLLFFIKLSRHCQRGTSQSTCLLAWETGLAAGLGLGYGCFHESQEALLYTSLLLTLASLAMYHLLTHSWFLRHKNR
jgi:MFS family permease